MSVSVSTVESSDPDSLTAASNQLASRIVRLDVVIADQRRALDELEASWQGRLRLRPSPGEKPTS